MSSPVSSPPYVLKQNLELTISDRQAGKSALKICLSYHTSLGLQMNATMATFVKRLLGITSRPPCLHSSSLPTEPPPSREGLALSFPCHYHNSPPSLQALCLCVGPCQNLFFHHFRFNLDSDSYCVYVFIRRIHSPVGNLEVREQRAGVDSLLLL